MKKILLLLFTICCISNLSNAQEPCGTKAPDDTWEQWFQTKIAERKADLTSGRIQQTNYNIPIIFHILYSNSNENISQSQVISQINLLNQDFGGYNTDINNVPTYFQSVLAIGTGIQFCLAKQTPNGTPLIEDGIDRININNYGFTNPSTFTDSILLKKYFRDVIKKNTYWDANRYLNIWITNLPNNLGGFAIFPIGSTLSDIQGYNELIIEDPLKPWHTGVVLDYENVGNNGTAKYPYNKGRSLTHEIAHYLGVLHISNGCNGFQGCGDDYCDDTPKQCGGYTPAGVSNPPPPGLNYGCPEAEWNKNTCRNLLYISQNPNGDMFMNYMDYTFDECKFMFTKDQAERMQTAMQYGTYRWTLNNSAACNSPNKPDFIVQNESLSVSSVNAGSNLTSYHKVKNQGTGAGTATYTAIWLSKDQVFNAQEDINLNADVAVPALISGQTSSQFTKSITIPAGTASGQWYIMFGADATTNYTNESNETNNQKFVPITIVNNTACSPTTPSGLSASPSTTSVYLSWNNISNVNYTVRYRKSGSSTWSYKYPSTNSITISSLSCGTTYEWAIQSVCSNTSTSSFSTGNNFTTSSCGSTSAIDNCSQALLLNSNTTCNYIRTNVSNTTQSGLSIPSCSGYQSDFAYDVWFKFVAQSTSHTITVDPEGTYSGSNNLYIDPIIAVYTSCSASTPIDCADDTGGGGGNCDITVNGLNIGSTYYIRVFDYNKVAVILPTYSNFDICVTHQDNICTPISNPYSTNITTTTATINWSNGSNMNDAFIRYRAVGTIDYYSGGSIYGTSSKTLSGLNCGTYYEYSIISNCVNGQQYKVDGTFSTSACQQPTCTAPYNLQLSSTPTQNTANLSWINGTNINNVFLKYRKMGTSPWSSSSPLMTTTTSYQITGLECNTQYECFVYSNCVGGGSISTFTNYLFTTAPCVSNCNISLPNTINYLYAVGGNNQQFLVNNSNNCNWTASTTCTSWITLTSTTGTGNGIVTYNVNANNTGSTRTCDILIKDANNLTVGTFTVVQYAACSYYLSNTSASYSSAGVSVYNFQISTLQTNGCAPWVAVSNSPWITITNGSTGVGNGNIAYSVAQNPNTTTRVGTITVAGLTYTITQSGTNCTYTFSPIVLNNLPYTGYTGTFTVTTQAGCSFQLDMIRCNGPSINDLVGTGTTTFNITYQPNTNTSLKSCMIVIVGQGDTLLLTQNGDPNCSFSLSRNSVSYNSNSITDSVLLTTTTNCIGSVRSNASWIVMPPQFYFLGSNNYVKYTVTQNNSVNPRTGTITIAGITYTITQTGLSCTSTITPTSKTAPQIGLIDSITVSLLNGCSWTAIANQTWITITGGSSGNGNGKVKYTVAQNNTGITRTGTITVAGKTFTITQSNIITAIYNNLIEDNYNVYPNPTNSILYIQSKVNNSKKITYSLNNLLGQAIEQNTIQINNLTEINLSKLPVGVYILYISDENGSGSLKVVKNK